MPSGRPLPQYDTDLGLSPNLNSEGTNTLITPPQQWDRYKTYPAGQAVYYNEVLYQALTDNLGQQPDVSPVAWILLASIQTGSVPATRLVNGHPLSADVTVTKSDVGLSNVTNVTQLPLSYLDTDPTLAANSDARVASQKAIKSYVDGWHSYGNMYDYNLGPGPTTVTIAATDVFYMVASGLAGGLCSGFTFQNNRELKCTRPATYLITWAMSIECSSNNHDIEGSIMLNGTGVDQAAAHSEFITGNHPTTITGSVILALAANDLVQLCVLDHTGTSTVTLDHATLTVVRIA